MERIMQITEEVMSDVKVLVNRFIRINDYANQSPEFKEDLLSETFLVLLEGYGGARIEGEKYFAVQMAARRLGWKSSSDEQTGVDLSTESNYRVMGNSGQNHEQDVDIKDWMDTKLSGYQQEIVHALMAGESQEQIAQSHGVSQPTIAARVKEIRIEAMKAGYNVN